MKTRSNAEIEFLPIIPVDDATRAMLAYAESPGGRAAIDQARRELREGGGIVVTPEHFSVLDRRIAKRSGRGGAIDA